MKGRDPFVTRCYIAALCCLAASLVMTAIRLALWLSR